MTNPEPIRINVDATNPGQFFACCGMLELAGRLWPGAEGWFEKTDFCLSADGTLREILSKLVQNVPNQLTTVGGQIPVKPIIAPLTLMLDANSRVLIIDFWMRVAIIKRRVQAVANRPWNFWSGQQTPLRIWLPLRDALQEVIAKHSDNELVQVLTLRSPLKGRFGFDSVAAWNALDLGFSPNDQQMPVNTSAASELLAVIGIQRFRPLVSDNRRSISYATWKFPADAIVAQTMASHTVLGCGTHYEVPVVDRGQYAALGHAKLIQGD
jgi:CRISPR-associated protein Csx14